MYTDIQLIRIINSLMMFSVTAQCVLILIILIHLNFSPPHLIREVGGKGMITLQQDMTLLHMKTLKSPLINTVLFL